MRVDVYGLGYVGCVTAACLASEGHSVVGIDIDASKVETVRAGVNPVAEEGLEAPEHRRRAVRLRRDAVHEVGAREVQPLLRDRATHVVEEVGPVAEVRTDPVHEVPLA